MSVKKVAHLGKYYPPASGGLESHVRTLARAQASLGLDVRVLCVNHADALGRDATFDALAATPTTEERDGPVRVTRLGRRAQVKRLDLCLGLLEALRELRRDKPDVVHLHVPNPGMLVGLAAVPPRSTLVVSYHSDVVSQRVLGAALRPVEDLVLGRASRILATSEAYASASPVLERHRARVAVLPLGVELAPFLDPGERALEHARRFLQEHGPTLWLSVGRLVYYKGLDVALAALVHAPGKLLVAGTGPLERELRERARSLGVSDRAVFLGRVDPDELAGLYHAARALWFPSNARSEGFGLVQVEAMASGCPVINTRIAGSGVPWVSRDGESGLTVAVNSPEELARASRRILDEPGLRERLSAGARSRACSELGHELMGRRSLELYEAAVEGGPILMQKSTAGVLL